MSDGQFDGFLKQVEMMHTQGKACFEAEFNVSNFIFLQPYCCVHKHTNAYIHCSVYVQSIEKKTAAPTVVAELNNAKNRYKNIFPCEPIVGCAQGTGVLLNMF